MDKRDGQEGLFRNTIRWAMSNNSRICVEHSHIKQPDQMGSFGDSGNEVETVAIAAKKRNNSGVRIKRDNNPEIVGEGKKGISDLQSNDHAKHLWTEKKRRKKMKNMFQELHALLPEQNPKAKLITIVDDAISHIQNLQQILQKLETQKLERLNSPSTNSSVTSLVQQNGESFLANGSSSTSHSDSVSCPNFGPFSFPLCQIPAFQTWASSNVILSVCGQDAHINICSSKKPGLLTAICTVLEKCKLDIISAHISSDESKNMFMIHSRLNAPDDFLAVFPYEEIYKLAALEMMVLANSKSS